jgi:protein SCO1
MPTAKKMPARKTRRLSPLPVFLAVFTLLLLAGGLLRLFGGVAERTTATIGGAFRLISGDGGVVTEKSFPSKYLLIYFGYASCPDICPTTLADIAGAVAQLGPRAARVQTLFITIDPKRDTPALLGRFVAQFSPAIIGLTGSVAEISKVEREYHVSVAIAPNRGGEGGYSIEHSAALYLIAPDGRFVTAFRADESGATIAKAIEKIVS